MSDDASTTARLSSAAAALRDTAKWLVGGIFATAASVFAGSSLTSLGSLDPHADLLRLGLALGGASVGFLGLAVMIVPAVAVLTLQTVTFRELVTAAEHRALVATLTARYSKLPAGAQTIPALLTTIEDPATPVAAMAQIKTFVDKVMADGGFLHVRAKFDAMIRALRLGVPLAILGFGLLAWAANPPSPRPGKPALLVINAP